MLMNNLDPDVAERPDDLIVYGGSGRAARSWEAFDAIVATLRRLDDDETLLVQSGKPVGVFRTHPWSPRVLIANALLVPAWATWDIFRDLEDRGLTMYGQMTAGSWIYIGTQGILQGTYETLAELARREFGGSLAGRLVVTAGLGGMGGAQPLAVTMNEGVALVIEVDAARIQRRLATRYLDERAGSLDDALARVEHCRRLARTALDRTRSQRRRRAAGACTARRRARRLTDQTSAHDALNGYVPNGMTLAEANALRRANPDEYVARSMSAMAVHVRAMLDLHARAGPSRSITATTSARRRRRPASRTRSTFPASCRSTSARSSAGARGRFAGPRSPAIPADIAATDRARARDVQPTTRRCADGFASPPIASRFRDCRPGSSGLATASAHSSAWRSTIWSAAASSRRRS